jgi:hypothetical protein
MKTHGNKDNAYKFGMMMEMTHQEIANEWCVTQQCVQQTEERALVKFKNNFKSMFPDTWYLVKEDILSGNFGREVMPLLQNKEDSREMYSQRG